MCGIIGAVSENDIVNVLLDGLKQLEYRGYDSAGFAVINPGNQLQRHRVIGKVRELQNLQEAEPLVGKIGIAHTRWATHGKPSTYNAHPHIVGDEIVIVHNGIIENQQNLRTQLLAQGCTLASDTDSELIAHMVHLKIKSGQDFITAAHNTAKELEGAFAVGMMRRNEPWRLIAFRSGSPLVIGLADKQNFLASDALAILSVAQKFIYLEEGDIADIRTDRVTIYNSHGDVIERPIHVSHFLQDVVSKGKYQHFMLKEIFEQPRAVAATLYGRSTKEQVLTETFGQKAPKLFPSIQRIQIVGCGTSYHAGLIGQYWLEEIAKIPCQVEIASENRYRHHIIEPNTLFVALSQSGETADTLSALRLAKINGYAATFSICNTPNSSIVNESDMNLLTAAGPEIGVAATKTFTTQLTTLFLLTLALGSCQKKIKSGTQASLLQHLVQLPQVIEQALKLNPIIKKLAKMIIDKQHVLFLGRGLHLPIALEGALKLKEISYIHAEAYPAGELKHGPLALVDSETPVIILAPYDDLINKLKSNLEEVHARGGKLLIFADKKSNIPKKPGMHTVIMPSVNEFLSPVIYAVAMQLLAYYVAALTENDIDQPRNLAKSVTVE